MCFNSLVKVTELIPYQEITKHLILARYFNSSSYNIRDKKHINCILSSYSKRRLNPRHMKSIKPPSEYLFTHSLFRHLLNLQVYGGSGYQNILENFPVWPYEDVRDGKFLNTYYYLVVMFKSSI